MSFCSFFYQSSLLLRMNSPSKRRRSFSVRLSPAEKYTKPWARTYWGIPQKIKATFGNFCRKVLAGDRRFPKSVLQDIKALSAEIQSKRKELFGIDENNPTSSIERSLVDNWSERKLRFFKDRSGSVKIFVSDKTRYKNIYKIFLGDLPVAERGALRPFYRLVQKQMRDQLQGISSSELTQAGDEQYQMAKQILDFRKIAYEEVPLDFLGEGTAKKGLKILDPSFSTNGKTPAIYSPHILQEGGFIAYFHYPHALFLSHAAIFFGKPDSSFEHENLHEDFHHRREEQKDELLSGQFRLRSGIKNPSLLDYEDHVSFDEIPAHLLQLSLYLEDLKKANTPGKKKLALERIQVFSRRVSLLNQHLVTAYSRMREAPHLAPEGLGAIISKSKAELSGSISLYQP